MTATLHGSTALVTGGNSGVGRATAVDVAAREAPVIITGRDGGRGEEVAVAQIRANGGKADFSATALSDEASARDLARQADDLGCGHVDVLVNNAGIIPFGPAEAASAAEFDSFYAVNVLAPFFLVAELAPAMAARGKAAIINVTTMVVSAMHGRVAPPPAGPSMRHCPGRRGQ